MCVISIGAQNMCTRYWPPLKQKEAYGKVQVKNLRETLKPHYTLREFVVHHEKVRWFVVCIYVCVCAGYIVMSFRTHSPASVHMCKYTCMTDVALGTTN